MAHHSSEVDRVMSEHMAKLLDEIPVMPKLGATGQFPLGKLTPHDEGELALAIGVKDGNVVIDFGTPTVWVGFTPTQARLIADTLLAKANVIDPIAK